MNAEIIAVGNEVLSGKQVNTNAQYLSKELLNLGVKVTKQVSVGDSKAAIKGAVADALGHANIVVLTGGLGPTKDDLTKDAICELLNINLAVDSDVSLGDLILCRSAGENTAIREEFLQAHSVSLAF